MTENSTSKIVASCRLRRLLTAAAGALLAVFSLAGAPKPAVAAPADLPAGLDPENTLVMELKYGRVFIAMRPDVAPKHVARIKELVRQGFYDGITFHRVIPGFMAQGGDPRGDGTGGSGVKLPAEFSNVPHERGTVSMARSSDPNSADSQFFICFDRQAYLDGQYTVWGKVVEGMAYVGMIKRGSGSNGMVTNPDKIISMKVAADVK